MTQRQFTLDEAQQWVPRLEETFAALAPLRQRLTDLQRQVAGLEGRIRSNGGNESERQLRARRKDMKQASDLIEDQLRPVGDSGILVKSIERGLVDFPSIRDGREVYLCWHPGESRVGFWHDVEAGFAGRQPL